MGKMRSRCSNKKDDLGVSCRLNELIQSLVVQSNARLVVLEGQKYRSSKHNTRSLNYNLAGSLFQLRPYAGGGQRQRIKMSHLDNFMGSLAYSHPAVV